MYTAVHPRCGATALTIASLGHNTDGRENEHSMHSEIRRMTTHPVKGWEIRLLHKSFSLSLENLLQELGIAHPQTMCPVAAISHYRALELFHMLLLESVPAQPKFRSKTWGTSIRKIILLRDREPLYLSCA